MNGFSAHADQAGLEGYVRDMQSKPSRTFLVHGELAQAEPLQERLSGYGIPGVSIPQPGETVALF